MREMHEALVTIIQRLNEVIAQVKSAIPNDVPLGNATNNWSFPGLTRNELIEEAQSLIDLIQNQGGDEVGNYEAQLRDYPRRLEHLKQYTVPQLSSQAVAVSAYLLTLQGLRKALAPALTDEARLNAIKLKKLIIQIRNLEAQLAELEPRSASIGAMVERIEQAYEAADQLPTDLKSLSEARQKISDLAKEATRDQSDVSRIRDAADETVMQLNKHADGAKAVLDRCETAYSAVTSVGLAAAFNERSNALSKSILLWIFGLVAALAFGSYFGSGQLRNLAAISQSTDALASAIAVNLLLSALSIGAPVWFAWLATKQIEQRFRLAEDYAFKASISRAYEGFRREAARFDKDMEAKLLTSALTRLDELPLRLVKTANYGSPLHELVSSDVVKQAMKLVPNFAEQLNNLATAALSAVLPEKIQQKPKSTSERDEE